MTRYHHLGTALAFLLAVSGVALTDRVSAEDAEAIHNVPAPDKGIWTEHNSVIYGLVDPALVGTWILARETNQGIDHPSAGRTLLISDAGVFIESFESEGVLDKSKLPNASDLPEDCEFRGVGRSTGKVLNVRKTDENEIGGSVPLLFERDILRPKERPRIECRVDGVTKAEITPSSALGALPGDGAAMTYTYALTADWKQLKLTSVSMSDHTFFFRRAK